MSGLAACRIAGQWARSWTPEMHGAAVERGLGAQCDGARVDVHYSAFAGTHQDAELIGRRNRPVPAGWKRQTATRDRQPVAEAVQEQDGSTNVAWYWYVVDDRIAVRPAHVKALQLRAILLGRPPGGFVVVAVASGRSVGSARTVLSEIRETLTARPAIPVVAGAADS
jgi:EpsI family protein